MKWGTRICWWIMLSRLQGNNMKIYIGSDHAGYELKEKIKEFLSNLDSYYEVIDRGAFEYDASDDYPDFVRLVADDVANTEGSFGIILGGSGQGEAICANRIKGVRAAVFYSPAVAKGAVDIKGQQSVDPFEIVKLARIHNDANVLSLSVRFLSEDEIKFAIELFLKIEFKSEERHARRIKKLDI